MFFVSCCSALLPFTNGQVLLSSATGNLLNSLEGNLVATVEHKKLPSRLSLFPHCHFVFFKDRIRWCLLKPASPVTGWGSCSFLAQSAPKNPYWFLDWHCCSPFCLLFPITLTQTIFQDSNPGMLIWDAGIRHSILVCILNEVDLTFNDVLVQKLWHCIGVSKWMFRIYIWALFPCG